MQTITDIINHTEKPRLYKKGTAVMWTDPYISKNLLDVHLNPELDLASRKPDAIHATIDWILDIAGRQSLDILDLGCGPGLYDNMLAQKGHRVTGVDFNPNSIEYARQTAREHQLNIDYRHQDYLTLADSEKYDLVMMIFTDFGVLLPEEQQRLLSNMYRALKPGGWLIFDALCDQSIPRSITPSQWEAFQTGFWRDTPHLVLSNSFSYEAEKVVLYQHCIVEDQRFEVYRFWTHFYSEDQLTSLLAQAGFQSPRVYRNVLPESGASGRNDVLFCTAKKG